jgi:hypothetical protein
MRVSVPANVLVQELDGESVFLNLNSGRYFGLDEVGTCFWKIMATSASVQTAYETLLAEYEVDPETLRRDLLRLVDELAEQGLVEVSRE